MTDGSRALDLPFRATEEASVEEDSSHSGGLHAEFSNQEAWLSMAS